MYLLKLLAHLPGAKRVKLIMTANPQFIFYTDSQICRRRQSEDAQWHVIRIQWNIHTNFVQVDRPGQQNTVHCHIITWSIFSKIFTKHCASPLLTHLPLDKMATITMVGLWAVIQVCSTPLRMVKCTHLITTGGMPHLYNRGSSMQVNSLHSGENDM